MFRGYPIIASLTTALLCGREQLRALADPYVRLFVCGDRWPAVDRGAGTARVRLAMR